MQEVDVFMGLINASASSADESKVGPPQIVRDAETKAMLAFVTVNLKDLCSLLRL